MVCTYLPLLIVSLLVAPMRITPSASLEAFVLLPE